MAAGLPRPEFESIPNFVCLTIRFKNPLSPYITDHNNSSLNETLNSAVLATYQLIKTNPGIKRKDIVARSGLVSSTRSRHIAILIKKKLIEHRDSKKTGGYYA